MRGPVCQTLIRICILYFLPPLPSYIRLTSGGAQRIGTYITYGIVLDFTAALGAVLPRYKAVKWNQFPQLQSESRTALWQHVTEKKAKALFDI